MRLAPQQSPWELAKLVGRLLASRRGEAGGLRGRQTQYAPRPLVAKPPSASVPLVPGIGDPPRSGSAAETRSRWAQLPRIPWRGHQGEWTALGVSADSPLLAGMDDRAAELADTRERRRQVGDGEVGKGGGVAGTRPAFVG